MTQSEQLQGPGDEVPAAPPPEPEDGQDDNGAGGQPRPDLDDDPER